MRPQAPDASPTEATSLLPRAEYPLPQPRLPALKPYVQSLPPGHNPSFDEIKYLPPLEDASSSLRTAFGLLVLLYLICEPDPLPINDNQLNAWDVWSDAKHRKERQLSLERALMQFWRDFELDDGDKDLEQILWTEFIVDGDSDRVLRVVDFLPNERVPAQFLSQGAIEHVLEASWTRGVPRQVPYDSAEPALVLHYDRLCTPRVMHAQALFVQVLYIGFIMHYVLWPDVVTIFSRKTVSAANPREIFIVLFSLSDVLCRPVAPVSLASLLTLLAFVLSFPSAPLPDHAPFSLLLLSLFMHVFNLHFTTPSPALLFPVSTITPMITLFRLLIARALRPAFYFCTPVVLLSSWFLSASLGEFGLGLVLASLGGALASPAETRLAALMMFFFGVMMFLFTMFGVVIVFPSIISPVPHVDPGVPPSRWDAYQPPAIGIAARRYFVRVLLVYAQTHYFPSPVAAVQLVFVSVPALLIRVIGGKDLAVNVRAGVQALLWRVLIAPSAVIIASLWGWKRQRR